MEGLIVTAAVIIFFFFKIGGAAVKRKRLLLFFFSVGKWKSEKAYTRTFYTLNQVYLERENIAILQYLLLHSELLTVCKGT